MTAEWDDALLFEIAVDPFQKTATAGREDGRAAGRRDGYLEGINIGRSKGWEIGLELGYIRDFAQGILDGYRERQDQLVLQQQQEQSLKSSNTNQQGDDKKLVGAPKQRTSHRIERCLTLARDVVKLIEEFPNPDSLFGKTHEDKAKSSDNSNTETCEPESDGECCTNGDKQCTEKSSDGVSCGKIDSDLETSNSHAADSLNLENDKIALATNSSSTMLDVSASQERIRAKFKLLCVLLKTKQQFDLKTILDLGGGGLEGKSSNAGEGVNNENLPIISREKHTGGLANDMSSMILNVPVKNGERKSGPDAEIGQGIPKNDSNALGSDW